jgi:hypothetical protein
MICDICNSAIVIKPACLLGAKEVVTSKDCWMLYLNRLIADHVLTFQDIQESLPALVGQLASSDTPWALCESCTDSLMRTEFSLHVIPNELSPHGHALCRSAKPMEFLLLDDEGMVKALTAANAAVNEIMSGNCE